MLICVSPLAYCGPLASVSPILVLRNETFTATCDRIFSASLRAWERDQAAACAPRIAEQETAAATIEAKRAGLLEAVKRKRRELQETDEEEAALQELVRQSAAPVVVPRLLYADATPEALSHALATGWPSAAVLSAEAGVVFGAHGMSFETILRNLAMLNVLWDGGEIDIDRRSKASYRLRDRRLTFGVMVQPETMRTFIERAGTLPRGTGFIARRAAGDFDAAQHASHALEAVLPHFAPGAADAAGAALLAGDWAEALALALQHLQMHRPADDADRVLVEHAAIDTGLVRGVPGRV